LKPHIHIKQADYRKLSDEELVRRYLELHEYNAYNVLFERFVPSVFGICLMMHIGNAPVARMKTEEIFIKMLQDLKQLKVGQFKSWLYNYAIEFITGKRNVIDELTGVSSAMAAYETPDPLARLPSAIDYAQINLSPDEQLCIKMFYEGNKSLAQIARETGMSMPKLKELLHSAKEHMPGRLALSAQMAHIFDNSVCLTSRQVKEYISGAMVAEECHAVEHHLNNCPLCSMAVDGMQIDPKEALVQLDALNTRFLNDHFSITYPQMHLSSFVTDSRSGRGVKSKKIPLWVHILLGTLITMAIAILFYAEQHKLHITFDGF